MADKWYEGFFAEFLRELGLEWWFHRPGRQVGGSAAPTGTTAGQAPVQPRGPQQPLVPPGLVLRLTREERKAQAPHFRGKIGDISTWSKEDQQTLADLPSEEMREFLEIYYPTLKERWGKFKEAVGRLDDNLKASPETKAWLDRWAAWLRRIR